MRDIADDFNPEWHDGPTTMNDRELRLISWTHPRREVLEVVCPHHEAQVLTALKTLGLGCTGRKAPKGTACMRCAVEASGREVRFAYGLVG